MRVYRCYAFTPGGWREFGIDYPTLGLAKDAVDRYAEWHPKVRYSIRHVTV